MKKETKQALTMVLEEMYENVKDYLISEVECCTSMVTSSVEESSRGVVHIANLLMELESDDINDQEWKLDDDDFEWIRDDYHNEVEYILEAVKDMLDETLQSEAITVTSMILGNTPSGFAKLLAKELTDGHKFTSKDYDKHMNYASGEWVKDSDTVRFYKSLDTDKKVAFLKMLDYELEPYNLTIRMSSGIIFKTDDGVVFRLMNDNKRVSAMRYIVDYAHNPKYEKLLEAIADNIVEEDDDELWVNLGLAKYWRIY